MKQIIHNQRVSLTIRAVLILLGGALIASFAFFQGMFYANKKATIQLADASCDYSVYALRAIKDPQYLRMALLFDMAMDKSALKLAEMSLRYPHDITRVEYNILVRVQAYRKQYGRAPERLAADVVEGREVDGKVTDAIAYLQSIHTMKDWLPYTGKEAELIREFGAQQKK